MSSFSRCVLFCLALSCHSWLVLRRFIFSLLCTLCAFVSSGLAGFLCFVFSSLFCSSLFSLFLLWSLVCALSLLQLVSFWPGPVWLYLVVSCLVVLVDPGCLFRSRCFFVPFSLRRVCVSSFFHAALFYESSRRKPG